MHVSQHIAMGINIIIILIQSHILYHLSLQYKSLCNKRNSRFLSALLPCASFMVGKF